MTRIGCHESEVFIQEANIRVSTYRGSSFNRCFRHGIGFKEAVGYLGHTDFHSKSLWGNLKVFLAEIMWTISALCIEIYLPVSS